MHSVKQIEESGAGQPVLLLVEEGASSEYASHLCRTPPDGCRVILLSLTETDSNQLAEEVIRFMDTAAIKQATLIGFANAGAVAQHVTIAYQKRIRRLIIVDSPTRAQMTTWEKCLSWLEHILPLGLPFRSVSQGFDGRSFLQRVRCPALVLFTPEASSFIKSQAQLERDLLATAWLSVIKSLEEFSVLLLEFLEIPAKRPQKNRA